jgi:hypothetical protein
MTTTPVAANENLSTISKTRKSWNLNPKLFNKLDIEMQDFSKDTDFLNKELRKVVSNVQPSMMTTISKSDPSLNHSATPTPLTT